MLLFKWIPPPFWVAIFSINSELLIFTCELSYNDIPPPSEIDSFSIIDELKIFRYDWWRAIPPPSSSVAVLLWIIQSSINTVSGVWVKNIPPPASASLFLILQFIILAPGYTSLIISK